MPPKRANSAAKAAAAQPLRRSTRRRSTPTRYTPPPPPPPKKVARKVVIKGKATAAKAVPKGKRKAEGELAQPQPKKSKANNGTAARGPGRPRNAAVPRKPSEKLAAASKSKAAPQNRKIAKATKSSAKAAKAAAPKAAPKPKKTLPIINTPPIQKLDIFAFGEGSNGELGLGAKNARGKNVIDVKRPRANHNLSADTVGVIALAVGGMHCVALTSDNKIFTWGVNDSGALGRDSTTEDVKLKDAEDDDSDSDSDFDEDSGLNPVEATPTQVDPSHFEEGTEFAGVFAGDNMSFALTATGLVYGWGSFRGVDGPMGFTSKVKIADTPMIIPELKEIVDIATGTNHVLALNKKGRCYIWGAGEQNQLGRRVVARTATGALTPRELPLPKKHVVSTIGAGDYHGFVTTTTGAVFSWGLNTFQQTGITKKSIDDDIINSPTLVDSLSGHKVTQISGGAHHTIALTDQGQVLFFGRMDESQAGVELENIAPAKIFYDEKGVAKFLKEPIILPNITASMVSTAVDTCMVVDTDGKAHSWGFSENFQTGHGSGAAVKKATQIDNSAIRNHKLVYCGLGGQFAMLGGVPAAEEADNVAPGLTDANAV